MMRILLIGGTGQLGWELHRTLAPLGDLVVVDYPEIDLVDIQETRALVRKAQADLIVNAAAYTAVDRAEDESDVAMAVNAHAPGVLAEEARKLDVGLIHYSTDYVFDGSKDGAYVEGDQPHPLNMYGRSKLAGEEAVQSVGGAYLILRTSWVYSLRQGGFVNKVLSWARQHRTMRIVSDQIGSPTWSRMLAEVSAQLIARSGERLAPWLRQNAGVYHLGGRGVVSRYEWARAILKYDPRSQEQVVEEIQTALTDEFPTPAERPLRTPLNCDHFENTFNLRLPDWETSLKLAMDADSKSG